jgi:alpha-beta hydrolase superfamily lysophospholipase
MPSPRRDRAAIATRPSRHWRAVVVATVVALALVVVFATPLPGVARAVSGRATARAAARAALQAARTAATEATEATDDALLPVTSTSVTLVDDTRPTPARGTTPTASSRTLTVTITTPDVDDGARYPLVVFVHGYDADAATYAALESDLAARGFVVAAPDFPLSSSALDGAPERDVVDQATDVSFVISALLGDASPTVRSEIADTPVAVVGHSDGAVTTAGVAFNDDYADPRVGAAVVLSGAEAFFPGPWFGNAGAPALLAIHGTDDEVNPFAASTTLYDDDPGSVKALVAVDGGSHLGPFTTDAVRPAIATLIADFLRGQLVGESDATAKVAADAAAPGLALVAAS